MSFKSNARCSLGVTVERARPAICAEMRCPVSISCLYNGLREKGLRVIVTRPCCHIYVRNRHLLATSMKLLLDQIAYMITAAHLIGPTFQGRLTPRFTLTSASNVESG